MKKLKQIITFVLLFAAVNFSETFGLPRNVLLEYCSGTWCGWCPCGHQTVHSIMNLYPNTIPIAYHGGSSSADPWKNFYGNEIRSLLGFTGYPTAIIDRKNTPSNPYITYDMWTGLVQNEYTVSPEAEVEISVSSKSYNSATGEFNLSVNSKALQNLTGQFKLNIILIENNLVYMQNHYSQCGASGYVQDYVHNHVVRSMVNGAAGENLNSGTSWDLNQTISRSLSSVLDSSWIASNCYAVIFVYKENSVMALGGVQQAIIEGITEITGISGNNSGTAENFVLNQNYPNPFNPSTNIKFSVPKDGNIRFSIYDILGNEVQNYINGFLRKGSYNVQIDGSSLTSGIYFYRLEADGYSESRKMLLVK